MNSSAAQVGEIFTEAGAAFNRLADLAMLLHPLAEQSTNTQAKTPVKRKVLDERQSTVPSSTGQNAAPTQSTVDMHQQVTLNMLNAQETEMDVEDIGGDVKLEFESSTEEVAT